MISIPILRPRQKGEPMTTGRLVGLAREAMQEDEMAIVHDGKPVGRSFLVHITLAETRRGVSIENGPLARERFAMLLDRPFCRLVAEAYYHVMLREADMHDFLLPEGRS